MRLNDAALTDKNTLMEILQAYIFFITKLLCLNEFFERYDWGQIHVEIAELLESLIKKKIQWSPQKGRSTTDPG